jgi:fibronectin-binding autotransporter adhesin
LTGNGDVFFTNATGTTGKSDFAITTKPLNNVGRLVFNRASLLGGAASTNFATGLTNTISGGVGVNVTSIEQAGNNPLTISSGSLLVGASGKEIVSSGSMLLTITSPISGAGDLTFRSNSPGVIKVDSATALGLSGSILHTGTGDSGDFASAPSTVGPASVVLSVPLGAGVTRVIQDSPKSALVFDAANAALSAPIEIRQGPLVFVNGGASVLGTGTVTVGTGAANASLVYAARYNGGSGAAYTLTNPIRVEGSGVNLIETGDFSLTLSGPITLDGNVVIAPNENYSGVTGVTVSGGITGTGNITASNSGGAQGGKIDFTTNPVNVAGKITFNNDAVDGGVAGTNSDANNITGGVGANVTEIVQASNTNPLVISTGSVNVNPAGLALTNNGSALLTVSAPTTGSGALNLNINAAGGITLSGALGNLGGVTLKRDGSGAASLGNYGGNLTVTGTGTSAFTIAGAYSGGQLTAASSASNTTFSGAWAIPAGGAELVAASAGTLTYSGVISGSGSLTFTSTGGGNFALSGSNTFTGNAILNQGTLTLSGATGNELGDLDGLRKFGAQWRQPPVWELHRLHAGRPRW